VTVVTDPQAGTVLHVADDRKAASLTTFYASLSPEQAAGIEAVSMDMWPAYINATRAHVPGAQDKIAFDRSHVAKLLGEAVDRVRRQEHRLLRAQGCDDLKGSRYVWLTDPARMTTLQKARFQALRRTTLKKARAWAIKDLGTTAAGRGRRRPGGWAGRSDVDWRRCARSR